MLKIKIILPIVLVMVVIVGAFVYTYTQKSQSADSMVKLLDETVVPKDKGMQKTDDTKGGDKMMMKEGSRYITYSKANLENAKNTRRVLFFYANWCPTCRPADASFSANESKIPADVILIRVNYNDTETEQEEKDLAIKYGITYQHTFVQIDGNGDVVTKWNGGQISEL